MVHFNHPLVVAVVVVVSPLMVAPKDAREARSVFSLSCTHRRLCRSEENGTDCIVVYLTADLWVEKEQIT